MAVTRYTLTGNVCTLSGVEFDSPSRIAAYVESNASTGAIIDLISNEIQLGTAVLNLTQSGSFNVNLIASNSADINATGIQYQVHINYPDDSLGRRVDWSSGWFSLTANTDLSDVLNEQFIPPNYQNQFVTEVNEVADELRDQMTALRDQTQVLRDQAGALVVSDLTTSDGQLSTLLNTPGSASRVALLAFYDAEILPLALMGVI